VRPSHSDIEAEVTKPARIDPAAGRRFEYGYFRRPPNASSGSNDGFYDGSPALELRDQLVCTHGPWVTEWQSHAPKPEIHPAELLWWSEDDDLVLVHVQDDSQRFDKRRAFNRYTRYGSGPTDWQPWARARDRVTTPRWRSRLEQT